MARDYGPIYGWHRGDTIPTEAEGGYAGAASTAAAVGTSLAQSGQAVQTVDNLAVTASTLDYGQPATATVTGGLPRKIIELGIPRGEPGMGHEEGQALLAQNQTTLDAAQQSAADAQTALQAQFMTQDEGVATLIEDETAGAQTRAALMGGFTPNQVDLVRLVHDNQPTYTSMRLSKVAGNKYRVAMDNGVSGVIYDFIKDTRDDFIKIDGCYVGGLSEGELFTYTPTTADLNGSWNTATQSWYTTTVGDSFEFTVQGGSRIEMDMLAESRGGIWSVSTDGGDPVVVSCWNATNDFGARRTIATGLDPNTTHTVVGTFMGDDPENPPSSSPSRGYWHMSPGIVVFGDTVQPTTTVLAQESNKEMAFTINTDGASNWLPDHGTPAAHQITAPQFYADGVPVDLVGAAVGYGIAASTVDLRQHVTGRVDAVATDVVEVTTKHTLTTSGLSFAGRMVAIHDVYIYAGYPLMMPGNMPLTDTFVTGLLNQHVNTGMEDNTYLRAERDAVHSGAVLSSTNPDVVAAATLANPHLSMRRHTSTGKPVLDESMFIWNRASLPKMYWKAFGETFLVPGDSYSWAFDMVVAQIPGIRSLINPA